MTTKPRQSAPRARLGLAALTAALALGLPGCGSEGEAEDDLAAARVAAPHGLDPAYAYTPDGPGPVEASEPMSLVYVPLLAYRREEGLRGAELIPGLARELPEISEDGRTYVLTLREGLEYSNGARVRVGDFEHAIKRLLTADTPATAFFERIEGAEEYMRADDPEADIRGIRSDEESGEILIELTEPDASFQNALAMWFAAPVPQSTSFRDRSADPPPGVGPYEITESVPERRFVLERSQTFAQLDLPDIPTGNIDTIATEVADSLEGQPRAVLEGEIDYVAGPPPEDLRSRLIATEDERYREAAGPGTFLIYFDSGAPPFADPRVREAVGFAIDRPALARLVDDGLEPGCSLLPPGTPGYDEELDSIECPYGDPDRGPDVERARRLVEAAGAAGAAVTVEAVAGSGLDEAARAYGEMLAGIGLEAEVRTVDSPGAPLPGAAADAGRTGLAGMVSDFPHPLAVYSLFGAGPGVPGLPDLGDRRVEREVERLNLEHELGSVADEWEALDRYLISPPQSYVVPFGHPRVAMLLSERLDPDRARFHPVYLNDHLSFALREAP